MNDDWVNVEEDLPQIGPEVDMQSIIVRCMTDTGKIRNGYYDYREQAWHIRGKQQHMRVIKWQSIGG